MKSARYSVSRQKACQQCSAAKVKCDRLEGCCSRCTQRELPCLYTRTAFSRGTAPRSLASDGPKNAAVDSAFGHDSSEPTSESPRTVETGPPAAQKADIFDIQDFLDLELICPINAEEISNRWLGAYIPLPNQTLKEYPANIKLFLHRVVQSYVTVTIHGRGCPPFIHRSQVASHLIKPPLSSCFNLVRSLETELPSNEGATVDVLQQEMKNLQEQCDACDAITLLCVFQAYLLLTMVLFFRLKQIAGPFLRQAVMNLQELACASARRGLACKAEQQLRCPKWESWIVAEANRRTLFTMYLFDGVLSAHDGLPTFMGSELRGLLAPSNGTLWRAQTRPDWETSYRSHLGEWPEGGLRIDELWRVPEDFHEADVISRQDRVDHWLQGVDEFGTMLYAVTSCTHGG
jgi:hypothetical protein